MFPYDINYFEHLKQKQTSEKKTCKFKVNRQSTCDNPSLYGRDYCQDHSKLKCECSVQATHICFEKESCTHPLCDNQFCITKHNLNTKHVRTFHEW